MKIAFLNNTRKEQYHFNHMAAISTMLALAYPSRIVMLENHYGPNSLNSGFYGKERREYSNTREEYLLQPKGLDRLFRNNIERSTWDDVIENSLLEVIQNRLYYLPQGRFLNHLAYEYAFHSEIHKLISELNQYADYVFLDTMCGNNLSTKLILEQADLVVVQLSQEFHVLEEFFENYSSLCNKAVFLINNYKSNSIYSVRYITNRYHIPKNSITPITFNMQLSEAYLQGFLISFLSNNFRVNAEHENYRIICELKRAVQIIVKYAKERKLCYAKEAQAVNEAIHYRS